MSENGKKAGGNKLTMTDQNGVLPDQVLAGIARGKEDIKAGRSISFDEFKKRLSINK